MAFWPVPFFLFRRQLRGGFVDAISLLPSGDADEEKKGLAHKSPSFPGQILLFKVFVL